MDLSDLRVPPHPTRPHANCAQPRFSRRSPADSAPKKPPGPMNLQVSEGVAPAEVLGAGTFLLSGVRAELLPC